MRPRMCLAVVIGSALLTVLTGCFALPWTRTGNQGGSTRIQALLKLANGELSALNADDVQVITDAAIEIGGLDIEPISDGLAQAVVDTFAANGVAAIADLERVGQAISSGSQTVVIPPEAEEYRAEVEDIIRKLSDPAVRQQLQENFQNLNVGSLLGAG